MTMNEEKIVEAINIINDTALDGLTDREQLVVLSNIILSISRKHLGKDLQKDSISIVSNGKSVAYELMKHVNDLGLNLAMKAHHIIDISQRIDNE